MSTGQPRRPGPFGQLLRAGWHPIPWAYVNDQKKPLLRGYHGRDRKVADRAIVAKWSRLKWRHTPQPGVVMPEGVLGLDVDDHVKDGERIDGMVAIGKFEAEHGVLPPTWAIRHAPEGEPAGDYGTRLYRVPASRLDSYRPGCVVGNLDRVAGPGVDVIAPWLRYNAAPGAMHKKGERYRWVRPDGSWADDGEVPSPDDLPELSEAQYDALHKSAPGTRARAAGGQEVTEAVYEAIPDDLDWEVWLGEHDDGAGGANQWAKPVRAAFNKWTERPSGATRHDTFRDASMALANLAGEGAKGAVAALRRLLADYAEVVGPDRADADVEAERMVAGAVAIAAGKAALRAEEAAREAGAVGASASGPYSVALSVKPYEFADEYLRRWHHDDEGRLTRRTTDAGLIYDYDADRGLYLPVIDSHAEADAVQNLVGALESSGDDIREVALKVNGNGSPSALVRAIKARTLIDGPAPGARVIPVIGGIPWADGWLDTRTEDFTRGCTPEMFNTWRIPLPYDDTEWTPDQTPAWVRFLQSIGFTKKSGGPEGAAAYRLLRAIMALPFYDGRIAKAPLLIGPPRSGKGTILDIEHALVGNDVGAVGLDLDALGGEFGLQNALGKRLITIGDARFGESLKGRVKTRILSITAGDVLPVNVKNGKPVSLRLDARLMIATNETPKFIEPSNALAERFAPLMFSRSYLGKEDNGLIAAVHEELPGIARWMLGGLRHLRKHGRLPETTAGRDLVQDMAENGSGVRVFVRECCELDVNAKETAADLYRSFVKWAERNNERVLTSRTFGTELLDAYRDRGVERNRTGVARGYVGVRLRDAQAWRMP